MDYPDASIEGINEVMQQSMDAFHIYRKVPLKERARLMRAIAIEIEALGDALIDIAMKETNLGEARLKTERARTLFQLNSYADACERAEWMHISIDTAMADRNPPKPDLRKMMIPLGPVVVFGASNFPFAYSTAGGDTACALAAGCTVVVKAHPAHAGTSEMVAEAINKAVKNMNLPAGVFMHVHGASFEVGKALVTHDLTKAVGFTGSLQGGKALFDSANQRKVPIPVFAEMGSINPVFLFPGKLSENAADTAKLYAGSITLSVGQFCTNPGLLIAIESEGLNHFIEQLGDEIRKVEPAKMLHEGIYTSYTEKRKKALAQKGVELVATAEEKQNHAHAAIATASAEAFLNNPILHHEVFGPYSLIIKCWNNQEMLKVVNKLEGQLTSTIIATEDDVKEYGEVIESIQNICGRFIYNGVPTGVEVCQAMHHGGPYPATTDSRFTSVGADGIKRFARPISYQNWPNHLLPDELKNENPLSIFRTINNKLTIDSIK